MNYTIRPCTTLQELAACVTLQKQIWGYAEHEVYPLRLFVNLNKTGGHTLGAFTPEGRQVGFVTSMPAWRSQRRYVHSLSLGVLPQHENKGLGGALKVAQRRAALRAGIEWIEWTIDPLRAKNAFFNVVGLGAIARRYLADHYGAVESRLHLGLPSDRLIAAWWLKSPRVKRALAGKPPRSNQKKPGMEVPIPSDIGSLMESDPARARAGQRALREQLQKCFARKLTITGFGLDRQTSRYLLDPYED